MSEASKQLDSLMIGAEGCCNYNGVIGSLTTAVGEMFQVPSAYLLTCAFTISRTAVRMDFLRSFTTSVEKMGDGVPAQLSRMG